MSKFLIRHRNCTLFFYAIDLYFFSSFIIPLMLYLFETIVVGAFNLIGFSSENDYFIPPLVRYEDLGTII
jgi:hypothetical protein